MVQFVHFNIVDNVSASGEYQFYHQIAQLMQAQQQQQMQHQQVCIIRIR